MVDGRTPRPVDSRAYAAGPVRARNLAAMPGPVVLPGYHRRVHILFVCTANICRSPMAAALFGRRLAERGEDVEVTSAGLLESGLPVPTEVADVMATYGIDLTGHRSRTLDPDLLGRADLVIGMARRHVEEAVLMDPSRWPLAFRLRELVRRGEDVGGRRPDQGIRSWIDAANGERSRASLARRSASDDIADPYGGPRRAYEETAAVLDDLTGRLVSLLWPDDQPQAGETAQGW